MYHNGLDSVLTFVLLWAAVWPIVRHLQWTVGERKGRSSFAYLAGLSALCGWVGFTYLDTYPTLAITASIIVLLLLPFVMITDSYQQRRHGAV